MKIIAITSLSAKLTKPPSLPVLADPPQTQNQNTKHQNETNSSVPPKGDEAAQNNRRKCEWLCKIKSEFTVILSRMFGVWNYHTLQDVNNIYGFVILFV